MNKVQEELKKKQENTECNDFLEKNNLVMKNENDEKEWNGYQSNDNNETQSKKISKIGKFILGEIIGKGSSSQVKRAQHSITQKIVAVKIIKGQKDDKAIKNARQEVDFLKKLQLENMHHSNIVEMFDFFETEKKLYIVMEYLGEGVHLDDYVLQHGKLSEKQIRLLFLQLVSAIGYCHQNGIVHRWLYWLLVSEIYINDYETIEILNMEIYL